MTYIITDIHATYKKYIEKLGLEDKKSATYINTLDKLNFKSFSNSDEFHFIGGFYEIPKIEIIFKRLIPFYSKAKYIIAV